MSGVGRQEQPYQLERRTAILLGLGMAALIAVGIVTPIVFGGSPCEDLAGVAARDGQLTARTVEDRPPRGLHAFAAGDELLLARVVAASSTQVDALQRLDASGAPVGECVDLALITEEPAFLLAVDGTATLLLRADDEERAVELRDRAGALQWRTSLDVPAGAPGGIAVETSGSLAPDAVPLELPMDADPPRLTLDRDTGAVVAPAGSG